MGAIAADMGGSKGDLAVAVVLPSYNEGVHVADVVLSLPTWVDIVVAVDDGSTDDTRARLDALDDTRLIVAVHPENRGFGAALRTGYQAALDAGADVVVKMDADGQMSPDDLATVVAPIAWGLADFAKGNRFYTWRQLVDMPTDRGIGNLVASVIAKPATGYWHVFDPHCGYTAIASDTLRQIDLAAMAGDYYFQIQQLMVVRALGGRVVDVPVQAIYGDEVSGMDFGNAIALPYELWGGWAWRRGRAGGLSRALGRARARTERYGEKGWWISPANLAVGLGSLFLAIALLGLGAFLGLLDRVGVGRGSPGSRETVAAARRREDGEYGKHRDTLSRKRGSESG